MLHFHNTKDESTRRFNILVRINSRLNTGAANEITGIGKEFGANLTQEICLKIDVTDSSEDSCI